jgi:hypothetical protein
MSESATPQVRERVWIEVIDHEQEPPQVIREMFFEDGRLQTVTDLTTTGRDARAVDDATT